ncbi:MAG: hypothetical protein ACREQ5_26975 [Candidatus Dormibacteria bacterium]
MVTSGVMVAADFDHAWPRAVDALLATDNGGHSWMTRPLPHELEPSLANQVSYRFVSPRTRIKPAQAVPEAASPTPPPTEPRLGGCPRRDLRPPRHGPSTSLEARHGALAARRRRRLRVAPFQAPMCERTARTR